MNFDVGEVFSRAGQITWKYRVLWIIGILFGFFISTMFLLMFLPFLLPLLIEGSRMDLMPVFIAGFIIAFLLLMLVLYPMNVFAPDTRFKTVARIAGTRIIKEIL